MTPAASSRKGRTVCLIHGSAHGPGSWTLVARDLERRGHEVVVPPLPLDRPEGDAAFYADQIALALGARGGDEGVVAVAHSAAGIFLPVLAARARAGTVGAMVFVAALVPIPGVSVIDQFRADPGMLHPAWVGRNPLDDAVALEFLLHDCPPERLAWGLASRVLLNARAALQEPCPLAAWPDVPSHFIVCAADRTITPAWQRRVARERLGVEPLEIAGGHCPQIARPDQLAGLLDRIADQPAVA